MKTKEITKKMNPTILNKKAHYDYEVLEKLEVGVVLQGTEIKSIRDGRCHLRDSWCNIVKSELYINGMFISKLGYAGVWEHEEARTRKLLAHKSEILKWEKKVQQDGYSIIPLKLYFVHGKAKLEIGLCRGKHNYDKRQSIKERDTQRSMARELTTR